MRALRVGVIRATVDRQMAVVVDRDLVLIEVLVFGEIRSTIKLDPGRFRSPAIPHHKMSDAGKVALARQLVFAGQSWVSRCDFGIVPQKLQNRQHPLLREEPALAQKPGAVGVLETVY